MKIRPIIRRLLHKDSLYHLLQCFLVLESRFLVKIHGKTDGPFDVLPAARLLFVYVQVAVGSAGILGNLTTIIILSTREMRNSFNLLLTILSTCDILFTVIALMDYSLGTGDP